jgi:FkbM family methyltransferase
MMLEKNIESSRFIKYKFKGMGIVSYLKDSFSRKSARRKFKKYAYRIDKFDLSREGVIEFANWQNPLIKPYTLTQKELDFFRELIPAGSFAIDIGAHVGSISVPMAFATGKEGLVLSFEPNPQVFEGLKLNSTLNAGRYRIVPLQLGVADQEADFHYASSEASMSNGGLILNENDNALGKHKLKDTIQTVQLSKYLVKHYSDRLNKLSFIKIDAEGLDLMIIKDLKSILEQYKPILIAEVYFSKTRSLSREEQQEMFSILQSIGYNLYNVENFEKSAAVDELIKQPLLSKENMPMGHTYNVLAMPVKSLY